MYTRSIAVLLAISGTYASPVVKRDTCSDACYASYNICRGAPDANRATCAAQYAGCLGYSPFDNSGSLVTPTSCSSTATATATPDTCVSGCNAAYNTCRSAPNANRSQCASQYSSCLGYAPFDNSGSLVTPTACSKSASAKPTTTSSPEACAKDCATKYDTCRGAPDANRATCASQYTSCLGYLPFNSEGSLVTPTACSASSAVTATATSVAGIPGGCNPAHPGSCPSSYFTYSTVTATAAASTQTGTVGSSAPAQSGGWTVKHLTRYCAENRSGCDYNFRLSFGDGSAEIGCTIVRLDVPNALTESWYNQPCDTGSDIKVSWGYSTQFTTPFAVMTVVKARQQAYFGVNDPNGQKVTAGNPAGSGSFGDIGPQPVFAN